MKLVADANILSSDAQIDFVGELLVLPGRKITSTVLKDADALLVRSVTRVNAELLDNTNIRFVGSATSGIDHIDESYLSSQGIQFHHAQGINANAVVDYCFAALAYAVINGYLKLEDTIVGLVGGGYVGELFAQKLEALGVGVKISDPPLKRLIEEGANDYSGSNRTYCSLDEILECDVISLHVPLIADGNWPTAGLIDLDKLQLLKPGAVVIQACRGGVVNENDLREFIGQNDDKLFVIDVWENEPLIDSLLVEQVDIATPHIAGYSFQGKSDARKLLLAHLKTFALGIKFNRDDELQETFAQQVPEEIYKKIKTDPTVSQWLLLLALYELDELSNELKGSLNSSKLNDNGAKSRIGSSISNLATFDGLRKQRSNHFEFRNFVLDRSQFNEAQCDIFAALGFKFD